MKELREAKFFGAGVINAYHLRRVAPLMAHHLMICEMTLDANLQGSVISNVTPGVEEVTRCIRVALGLLGTFVFKIDWHTPMHPVVGSVALVRIPSLFLFLRLRPLLSPFLFFVLTC